jgi:rhodanese-related sulfurtransferase
MLSFEEYVSTIKLDVTEITPQMLAEMQGNGLLLIDVRESNEVKDGVISNAIPISRGVLEAQVISLAPYSDSGNAKQWLQQQKIVLYCRSGARSALAVSSLKAMELNQVMSLKGGLAGWFEAGYPIVKPTQ